MWAALGKGERERIKDFKEVQISKRYRGRMRDETGKIHWRQMTMASMMTVDFKVGFEAIYSKLYSIHKIKNIALYLTEVRHIQV